MTTYRYSRPASEAELGAVLLGIFENLSPGDRVVVDDVSHLAESMGDLRMALYVIETKGAILVPLSIGGNPGEPLEERFRADLRRAAVARARARGAYVDNTGRPRSVDRDRVRDLLRTGLKPDAVARRLGCSKSAVYAIRAKMPAGS
jgi:DNA invertase Pin-like site-specific DNA recombinase